MSRSPDPSHKDFSFGFEKVTAPEKTQKVKGVFERVSDQYDVMNDVMSLGLHRLWKQRFVESLPLKKGGMYLDVAGGTGDIASAIKHRFTSFGIQSDIIVSDINPSMIERGKTRHPHLRWICTNGEHLPFEDNSIDVYTIAFGLRNITHREKALDEAYRVLKPGGQFSCLEFSHVSPPLRKLYDIYSFCIIPKMGEWIAKDREAYQYLSESIRTFPSAEDLLSLLKKSRFKQASYTLYSKGIVGVHSGYKI